jgi:HTH-type transcriptional regulator / antitoxin HigA
MRETGFYFGPIRNERDYARMLALLDELLDEVGADEAHPLVDLLDVVGLLIAQYDHENGPRVEQADLRKEIGTQGVVSEILAGGRKINMRQAKALAQRFGVSPVVFF